MITQIDIDHLILKYSKQVPRYTSYPSAPYFTSAVTGDIHKNRLTSIPESTPLSLYFHIPYCSVLCWYCGCPTKIVKKQEIVQSYIQLLEKEISLVAQALGKTHNVSHIHFGGGSPNMVDEESFSRLMNTVGKHFRLLDTTQFAIEVDPRGITEEKILTYAREGVNRISIGVQDFDPNVQKAINRVQPYSIVQKTVDLSRKHGIEHINFDLMYGLPLQTIDGITQNIDTTLSLHPNRIAFFGYAHVPWKIKHMRLIPDNTLPDTATRLKMFRNACRHFIDNDYVPVGLDHFVKKDDSMVTALKNGTLQRNFQGYTTDTSDTLVGIGIFSISKTPSGYAQNTEDRETYQNAILSGTLPTVRGLEMSEEDHVRGKIIESLMCHMKVDVNAVCQKFNRSLHEFDQAFDRLKPLIEDGLITITNGSIEIHPDARQLSRIVSAAFDQYFDPQITVPKHSAAI